MADGAGLPVLCSAPVREEDGLLAALRSEPAACLQPCVGELRLQNNFRVGSDPCAATKPSEDMLLARQWVARPYSDPVVHSGFGPNIHRQAWQVDLEALASGATAEQR